MLEFRDSKDKVDVFNILRSQLEQSGCVVTEDSRFVYGTSNEISLSSSRSRLSGEVPKAVSNKLDFESFLKHYQSYDVAQALFNKMVKIL